MMRSTPMKTRLHILSPVHIGSGEVFEPISFYIDTENNRLCLFEPADFIDSLDELARKNFSEICMKNDLLQVMRFINKHSAKVPVSATIEIPSAVAARYEEVLRMSSFDRSKVINRFTLGRTSYCPNGLFSYIPGSSLKGSLRTAYLNYLNKGQRSQTDSRKHKLLEKELLGGSFDKDPFRMLHVPDLLPVKNLKTRLVYAVNRKKRMVDTGKGLLSEKGPDQILEVIEPGAVFEGILRLDAPDRLSGIENPLAAGSLLTAVKQFFTARYEAERETLRTIGAESFYREMDDRLLGFKATLGATAVIVRIGRHSGAEAHTLDGVRNIRIMKGRPEFQSAATTIWLASDYRDSRAENDCRAFGWAVLELMPIQTGASWMLNPLPDTLREAAAAAGAENRQRTAVEAEVRRDKSRQAQEAKAKAEAASKVREEEEARVRAEWESLTDEEQLIRMPGLSDVSEQQVVDCFNRLDTLASPHKERLAEALKQYYIKHRKWEGGSKKQVEKVKKLKAILGG